ncbi:MAG: bacteriocin-protection protein [Chloroflexi bacterium]|nr:MAG: bacteriocin-protection protein [Actinobacteria bacterium 13_2_20CM_2_66_6]TMD35372.1 MAG: bacteriocin-protection protein [Chloroflexota bacterium]TMD73967.1 MAG: bacteriocin-protection protein [Chloroflexota bacterium]
MPRPENVVFFATPAELRAWFEANHDTAKELWLGYHKKRSGRPSVTWPEVVDQELCFGWIDSVRYSLSDDRSAQRITPRRKRSVWSAVNIRRFGELDKLGLVHPSGHAAFDARDEARSRIYAYENRSAGFDQAREAEFRRHRTAWKFFESQAPWYRRTATYWVMSAKREETRDRRLKVLIDQSKNGERIGPLTRPSPRSRRLVS